MDERLGVRLEDVALAVGHHDWAKQYRLLR
jgi:hypothetical protein